MRMRYRQTGRQAGGQVGEWTDRQTDRETDRETDRQQADRQQTDNRDTATDTHFAGITISSVSDVSSSTGTVLSDACFYSTKQTS